jgi:hypothetical protein
LSWNAVMSQLHENDVTSSSTYGQDVHEKISNSVHYLLNNGHLHFT